jgi:plasmid stabilization system protein ParE
VKRYLLTGPAAADLDDILDYIAAQSVRNAVLVATRLEAPFGRIADAPGIGHRGEELRDDSLRVIATSGYVVIYGPTSKPLHILRVVRGMRELRRVVTRR